MNQVVAHRTRRDIRRAIGPQGLDTVNNLTQTVRELVPLADRHSNAIIRLRQDQQADRATMVALDNRLFAFQSMNRWQRLLWVLGF